MGFTKESAVEKAKRDLAARLRIGLDDVRLVEVEDTDFPDMSLGAPSDGEMSAQMISSGWRIDLEADGESYEYRADKYQLRLHNFNGSNFVIV
jgi:hypothetical protein